MADEQQQQQENVAEGSAFTKEEIDAFRHFQTLRDAFNAIKHAAIPPARTDFDKALAAVEEAERTLPADIFSCREEACGKRLVFDAVEYHWTCPNRGHSELLVPTIEF